LRRRDPVRREGTLGPVRRAFRLRRLPPLCLEPAGGGPQGALGVEKNMEGRCEAGPACRGDVKGTVMK